MKVHKVRWVIHVHLAKDGSVAKVKARLVACGYSMEHDKTYAHTLPGPCFRLWVSIVADEDMETDHIDAVKAFTQAEVDRLIHVAMPEGFEIADCVLLLLKALEGIPQGAALWFAKNKWAWNKCNCFADPAEPNLYTAPIDAVIAVFADDVGAGFQARCRAEYLKLRGAYSELIKIDSPGPDTTVPVVVFTQIQLERDRQRRTIKVHQENYINKLKRSSPGSIRLTRCQWEPAKQSGKSTKT